MGLQNGSLDASKLIQNTEVLEKKLDPVINKLDEVIDKIDQLDGKKAKASVEIDTGDSSKNVDEVKHEFEELLKTIKAPNQKKNYFQSIENSAKDLKKAWRDLVNEAGKGTFTEAEKYDNQYATTVLRCANAFEALKGNISEVSPEIFEFVQGMRQIEKYSDARGYNFTVKGFEQAFEVFAKMKEVGATYNGFDFSKGFTEVKQDILELSSLTSIWSQSSSSASEQASEAYAGQGKAAEEAAKKIEKLTEAEMERKLKSEHEKSYVDDLDVRYDWDLSDIERYSKALDELREKQKTALQNATKSQNEFVRWGNEFGDEDYMNNYIAEYHKYTDQIEFVQKRLQEAIRDYTPNASGETGQELNALIIILRDLHEEILKISSAFANVDETSGIGALIKSINEMSIALSEAIIKVGDLGEAFAGKDFSININAGNNSNPIDRQRKIGRSSRETIDILRKTFDALSDELLGGTTTTLFQGLGKQFKDFYEVSARMNPDSDSLDATIYNYQKLIAILKEAANIKGIDISEWSNSFEKASIEAVEATNKIIDGEEETEKATNKLFDLFGKANNVNLKDMTVQLDGVVQELKTIAELVEKGFTVNDILNGKPVDTGEEVKGLEAVKRSVESIKIAVDEKTEAFEKEASKIAQIVPTETGYLSKLISALKIINEQLEKISSFTGLDLSNVKVPEIKKGKIATGATNVSGDPKEAIKRKERTVTKADAEMTAEQIAARTLSLTQTTEKLEQDLKLNGSIIKQIIEFYDSQDNLVKTVIKEEKELNGLLQQTTWTTNYNLKDGNSFTSHIDTENYDKSNKAQQKLSSDWDEAIRINQELDKANKYSEDYVYSLQQSIDYEREEKEYLKERNRLLAEGKKQEAEYYKQKKASEKLEQSSISKRTDVSYNKELKLEREINKLKIKNISASEEDVAYNNVLISRKEELIQKERAYRTAMNLVSVNKEAELINKKTTLTQELIAAQDAYNVRLKEEQAIQLELNRQKALEFTKHAKNKLEKAVKKYNYGNSTEAQEKISKFNSGVSSLGDLSNIEKTIKNCSIDIDRIVSELKDSHQRNLNEINKEINDTENATKQNNKAAKAYDNLFKSAKKYYKLKQKEATGSLLDEEIKLLNDLEKEWEDAYQAKGRYAGNSRGDVESSVKLDTARQNFIDNNLSSYQTSIKKFASDTQNALDKIKLNKKNFQYGDDYYELIDKLQAKITELNSKNLDVVSPKELQEVSKLQSIIDSLLTSIKNQTKNLDFQLADSEKVYQQMAKIEQTLINNTAMPRTLKESFKALSREYQLVIDTKGSQNRLEELNVELGKLNYQLQASGKTGNSIFTLLGKKIKSISTNFVAMYLSFYDLARYLRQGFETIREFDTALTEMRKVSDETVSSLERFQDVSFDLADGVGTTAKAIQDATADWMRLGESLEEAKQSAQDANVLFRVSEFESIDEATESLVAMSAAYKDLEKSQINDVLNEIGNNYAISTDELASALQKSAATLSVAGNDIYEAAALVTAGNAVLQDADSVGTGLKMISLRILGTQEAKDELASLGEDVDDFVVQTKSKIDETVRNFTAVTSNDFKGISVLDDNGNYRSTYEILRDISQVYQEILETDKKAGTNRGQALLEVLAGKNRSNVAASILQSPELLTSAYESAMKSAGSAQEELDKFLESIDGRMAKLENQAQEFWFKFIDSDTIKNGITLLTELLGLATDFVDTFGALGIAGAIGGGILGAKKGLGLTNYIVTQS